ncbi:LuxR family transcriptional regulator [Salipiger mucosus]|uniref:Autoinducer-binding protein transcriptional regulator, LuxR family n=1 Tax=Salipiger mucosus DSM 16094 TaxID=1123237 RepID=S9S093_9RHOB|nr:LuxR family transcriptional regulator [Salipiger mucosus]EPX83620.1 Autoinducer-binding protein transcriptional regulator, LuxR family [Salipiger mucosus DSM 16094]
MTPEDRDYLVALTNASNVEDLWAMHVERMALHGFDRLLYGFTRYRTETSLGDPNDFVLLTNHAAEYTDVFIGQGLYHEAPMVRWALENDGACSWRVLGEMVEQGNLSDGERRVIDFNLSQDVRAGYSVSFRSVSSRAKGAIALTARAGTPQTDVDALWEEHGEDIVLMNNIVHLKLLTLPYVPGDQTLTRRQRQALEWVGDGKTMQDIAAIMGLSQATVEKHLRLAREALNVETTAQAVAKAAFQNQMFVIDPPSAALESAGANRASR